MLRGGTHCDPKVERVYASVPKLPYGLVFEETKIMAVPAEFENPLDW